MTMSTRVAASCLRRHYSQRRIGFRSARRVAWFSDSAEKKSEDELSFYSPKVKELFSAMKNLEPSEIDMIGRILAEKLGIQIVKGGGLGSEASSGGETAEAPEEKAAEKTAFDLKLTGFDAKAKIKVIKEVRAIASLGLKEAKELVEGAPKTVKKGIKMEEAEELKKKLEEVGATIEIE